MLIGSIKRFAIEYTIREFYENNFIGDGKFLVYINGIPYGQNRDDSTTFSCIIPELGKRIITRKITDKILRENGHAEIAHNYYDCFFADEPKTTYFGLSKKDFEKVIIENNCSWNGMDEAFDDGSFILQINMNSTTTKLIGFKAISCFPVEIEKISTIEISVDVFNTTIQQFIESLKTDFVNNYGHGDGLDVFNWWKKE